MYHNIIFDLGGVVINYDPKGYLVDRFYNKSTEQKLYNAVFGSEEWAQLDRGQISWQEAQSIFLQRGVEQNIAFEMDTVMDEWVDMLSTRSATVALMRLLKKKGFKLYYLSDISKEVLDLIKQRDFWGLFDGGVASCEVGLTKPDLNIYNTLLEKYDLVAQETIFADDLRANTAAAFNVGITGIQFKNVKSFCKMLVIYGIEI